MSKFIPDPPGTYQVLTSKVNPKSIMRRYIENKEIDIPKIQQIESLVEFIMGNNLNYCQGKIIEHICQYQDKNSIEDLKNARYYIDLLIQMEFPNEKVDVQTK